jgi:hypothetical protein
MRWSWRRPECRGRIVDEVENRQTEPSSRRQLGEGSCSMPAPSNGRLPGLFGVRTLNLLCDYSEITLVRDSAI